MPKKPKKSDSRPVLAKNRKTDHPILATLDSLLEGCQIISPEWRYVYVNDSVAKQGKHTKEDLLGRTMMELYPGIEKTPMFANLRRCMTERVPCYMENEFEFPDKSKGWFELRMEPILEGVFILSLDITARKRAEELKRQAEIAKAKEDFLFRTVHDLRSPTNVIRMAVAEYEEQGLHEKYPEMKKNLNILKEVSARMAKLIEYLFEYAKGERKEIILKKEPLEIGGIIEATIQELDIAAKKKNAKIIYAPGSLPQIFGDSDSLKEVFVNLVENAIKYNKEGGLIRITHKVADSKLQTVVEDSGIGVPPDSLPKLFTPYFRAYEGGDIQGNGLGLFIVKGLVEKMGGTVEVSSVLGKGTTFTVSLPLTQKNS